MFNMFMSILPKVVQASNDKVNYNMATPKAVALKNYKFIQLNNGYMSKLISIDIDNHATISNVYDVYLFCFDNNIPKPNIVVETTRGFHVHWLLATPVWHNNNKQMFVFKQIKNKLNELLSGDKSFSGFIIRNPLKHNSVADITFSYDFKDFLSPSEYTSYNIGRKRYKDVDLTKVMRGERNNSMLRYLRTYYFRNYKYIHDIDMLIEIAKEANKLLVHPLTYSEIKTISKSVFYFVQKHYNPSYYKENRVVYNRQLAKRKAERTQAKIIQNTSINLKNINIIDLFRGKLSIYSLAKLLKVDRKTIKKYLELIKNSIKLLIIKQHEGTKIDITVLKDKALTLILEKTQTKEREILLC